MAEVEVPESVVGPESLATAYDVAVLDLDGVVYIGAAAVPGAVLGLANARTVGMKLAFVTNNASRSPEEVAEHLTRLGIPAAAPDVVTSAQAAARVMAQEVPPGSAVFVIGGAGLHRALLERGLRPVTESGSETEVAGVVQGFGPEMPWRQVIDGALLVRSGLPWVASNMDLTVPTPSGPGPGNGTLVNLVAEYSGRTPLVAGKPQPPLFSETVARVGGERPLVIGDRIDTDIEGAIAMGWDSVLVMSGVTGLGDLAVLPAEMRPTYVGADVGCLTGPAVPVLPVAGRAVVAGWRADVHDGALRVSGSGDLHTWWQAASAALWGYLDTSGQPADVAGVSPGSVAP